MKPCQQACGPRSTRSHQACRSRTGAVTLVHALDVQAAGDAVRPGSVLVNATGLGKTEPGPPLSEPVALRGAASAWDFTTVARPSCSTPAAEYLKTPQLSLASDACPDH
jgi:shikimate 5-dehydrogenase